MRAGALALLCAADLLVAVDGMVVTVALPAIQREFGTAPEDLQWIVIAYTLSLGAFLLVGGRAADLFGRRRVLVFGLTVFALASLAAGLAPSTGVLLAARAVQGFGAALAIPAALALISASYRQERERDRAVGLLATSITTGMGAGLVLGGMLTAWLGWPWCFFIVVPFGLAAAALAPAVLEESRDTTGAGSTWWARCSPPPASVSSRTAWRARSMTARPRRFPGPQAWCCWRRSSRWSGGTRRRWSGWASSGTGR